MFSPPFASFIFIFISTNFNGGECQESTLILAHTLFRHGDRTNDVLTVYPNDPYINETYYPVGWGQLTNKGKMTEYKIGTALRKRYGAFLGKTYFPGLLDARSTDFNRTKASLELMLAGLFPPTPKQTWNDQLPWQPIPYNYWPQDRDNLLLFFACPNFGLFLSDYSTSPDVQAQFTNYKELFKFLTYYTGWNVVSFSDCYKLYFALRTESEWGLELPEWTKNVYPQPLENIAITQYHIMAGNSLLKQMAGILLGKIISDTQAKIKNQNWIKDTKLFIYSAHEINVALFLLVLGVFDNKIPNYGSYVLVEVHKIDDVYGFKFFHQNYDTSTAQPLNLPDCGEFCPLDKFIKIYGKYVPRDANLVCGRSTPVGLDSFLKN